jgi:hypothetical protein
MFEKVNAETVKIITAIIALIIAILQLLARI